MKKFEEQKFQIPKLKGLSDKSVEEHLKLYAGYVKNTNLVLEHINELAQNAEKYAYELGELQRRFAFEFDGMRNHEYYFAQFEGSPKAISPKSELGEMLDREWGSFENWLNRLKAIALTRGIGWAFLYYDPQTKRLLNQWIDEQHFGHLTGLSPILTLDMWEHAYIADYQPSGKKNYIEDFFVNLNWEVVEKNFNKAKTT
ncbi:MAG: Fe-Mn family superoxide dismutase [Patescibacteria group bacterium]